MYGYETNELIVSSALNGDIGTCIKAHILIGV